MLVFISAITDIRAESRDHRVTSRCISATVQDQRAAQLSLITPRASTSTTRMPAPPVSVYRTHCTRCSRSSRSWDSATITLVDTTIESETKREMMNTRSRSTLSGNGSRTKLLNQKQNKQTKRHPKIFFDNFTLLPSPVRRALHWI